MRKKSDAPSRSSNCPICGGTFWRTYDVGIIPDYGRAHPFATLCEKCKTKYRAADETGISTEYCDTNNLDGESLRFFGYPKGYVSQ